MKRVNITKLNVKLRREILLLCIMLISAVFVGCSSFGQEERSDPKPEETLESMEEPLTIFNDGTGYFLLNSFQKTHPEINIRLVNCLPNTDTGFDEFNMNEIIEQHGNPDLIIARDELSVYLSEMFKEGHIANLTDFCTSDSSIDIEDYFPETFEVFKEEGNLLALPLGISMDFMVTSESKYYNSAFSKLEDGYAGKELLNAMLEEVQKEKEEGEFFCEISMSLLRFLYYLDGITISDDGISIDEELFKMIYEYIYEEWKTKEKAMEYWDEQGISNNSSMGLFDPRRHEGKFTISTGFWDDAPALQISYAETAYQYYVEEGVKAIYIPTAEDGRKYQAMVKVWGSVSAECKHKELAYELLRLLMDEEINSFVSGVGSIPAGSGILNVNVYPINVENAVSLLERFESQIAKLTYGSQNAIILDRANVSLVEKEKHENMLRNISGLFCWTKELSEIDSIFEVYYAAGMSDYKKCYLDMINTLNTGEIIRYISNPDDLGSETEESFVVSEKEYDEITDVSDIKDKIRDVKIGETFFFGEVEQDNDLSNGAEAIEWIVLKKTDSSAFVISKKVLEWMTFSEYKDQITVDEVEVTVPLNCFIWDIECNQQRAWLTNELYANGFSEIEKEVIVLSHIETQGWEVSDPESTDYLYIPSKEEVEEYLSDIHLKQAEMTAYVAAKAEQKEGEYIRWSVRTEGPTQKYVMQVLESGKLSSTYCSFPNGVRPVMWLDIS